MKQEMGRGEKKKGCFPVRSSSNTYVIRAVMVHRRHVHAIFLPVSIFCVGVFYYLPIISMVSFVLICMVIFQFVLLVSDHQLSTLAVRLLCEHLKPSSNKLFESSFLIIGRSCLIWTKN